MKDSKITLEIGTKLNSSVVELFALASTIFCSFMVAIRYILANFSTFCCMVAVMTVKNSKPSSMWFQPNPIF
jgi:hypothetical protein